MSVLDSPEQLMMYAQSTGDVSFSSSFIATLFLVLLLLLLCTFLLLGVWKADFLCRVYRGRDYGLQPCCVALRSQRRGGERRWLCGRVIEVLNTLGVEFETVVM